MLASESLSLSLSQRHTHFPPLGSLYLVCLSLPSILCPPTFLRDRPVVNRLGSDISPFTGAGVKSIGGLTYLERGFSYILFLCGILLLLLGLVTMKFGRNLTRNMVPEWCASYINYKSLKQRIKCAAEARKLGEEPDLAGEEDFHLHLSPFQDISLMLCVLYRVLLFSGSKPRGC